MPFRNAILEGVERLQAGIGDGHAKHARSELRDARERREREILFLGDNAANEGGALPLVANRKPLGAIRDFRGKYLVR